LKRKITISFSWFAKLGGNLEKGIVMKQKNNRFVQGGKK